MKNNKMMKASVASAMLLGLVAPTVLATTNVATAAQEQKDDSLPADIDATTGPDSITIESSNGIPLNDQKFDAYRLMDAHYVNDKQEGYVIIPAWQEFFNQEVKKKKDETCSNQEAQLYLISMQNSPEKFKGFKERVYEYAKKHDIKALGTPQAEKDTYKISNLPDGYYIVIQQEDEKTVSLSKDMLVTVDGHNKNATIKLKADVPSLLKTINGSGTNNQDKKAADYAIGDDVPFRLVSKVPDMSGFKKDDQGQHGGRYVFEIQDTMSKGLTLNQDSIKVTIGGVDYKDFDLVNAGTTRDGSTLWKLVFGIDKENGPKDQCTVDKDGAKKSKKDGNLKESLSDDDGVLNDPMFKNNAGKAIQVSYSATLNSDAILGGLGNPNTANVLYSSNPYQPEKVNNTWDSTTHAFTFGLDLTKVDDTKKALAGAEFELQTDKGKKIAVTKSGDTYIVTNKENTEGKNTTVVSNDEGKIIIKGLDAGNYKLVETKAPAGYNLLKEPIEFGIQPTYSIDEHNGFEGKLTELKVTGKNANLFSVNKEKGFVSTEVVNKAGGLLPKTGGRGIFMLAVIGLALMALATYVLFGRKKATK